MTNIIKFPKATEATATVVQDTPQQAEKAAPTVKVNGVFARVLKTVWVVTVLVWPVLKWVVSIDVFFQFIRMMYHWNTPGVHAGWTFLLHFAVLTALTYFVSLYKPKRL
jgi:hypothetical protein